MNTTCRWLVGTIALAASLLVPVPRGLAEDAPASVHIDSLSHLYAGVDFDHAAHVELAGGCALCHHRGPGALAQGQRCRQCHPNAAREPVGACRACHSPAPFSAKSLAERGQADQLHHRDVLGLKGAYHLACTGCHREMGGPTGCLDCHGRTAAGDAFYHAGKYAPKGASAEP